MREINLVIKIPNWKEIKNWLKTLIFRFFIIFNKKVKEIFLRLYIDFKNKKLITVCLIISSILIFWVWNFYYAILLLILFSYIFYRWDSRAIALAALVLLASCPFLIILKQQIFAEQIAVYAYYFLIITVILQIIEHKRGDHAQEEAMDKEIQEEIMPIWESEFMSPGLSTVPASIVEPIKESVDLPGYDEYLHDSEEIERSKRSWYFRMYLKFNILLNKTRDIVGKGGGVFVSLKKKTVYVFHDIMFCWTKDALRITGNAIKMNFTSAGRAVKRVVRKFKFSAIYKIKRPENIFKNSVKVKIDGESFVVNVPPQIKKVDYSPNFIQVSLTRRVGKKLFALFKIVFSLPVVINFAVLIISFYYVRQTILQGDPASLIIKLFISTFIIILVNFLININYKRKK